MSTISYKGFRASVQCEDGHHFVKVLGIDDLLIARCSEVLQAEDALAELVDAYLDDLGQR